MRRPENELLLGKVYGGAIAGSSWWGTFWLAFTLIGGIVWSVANAI